MEDLKDLVEDTLLKNPETRDKDELLYLEILRLKGFYLQPNVFVNYKSYKFPSFGSVSRARRKVQEIERQTKEPKAWKLQSSKTMNKHRRELEQEYREYYRN
ncbi:MAG: hypothetical protein Q4B23_05915 [Helcococcus sp.]|nr:hypothetical protein [Helcococcus sp.]